MVIYQIQEFIEEKFFWIVGIIAFTLVIYNLTLITDYSALGAPPTRDGSTKQGILFGKILMKMLIGFAETIGLVIGVWVPFWIWGKLQDIYRERKNFKELKDKFQKIKKQFLESPQGKLLYDLKQFESKITRNPWHLPFKYRKLRKQVAHLMPRIKELKIQEDQQAAQKEAERIKKEEGDKNREEQEFNDQVKDVYWVFRGQKHTDSIPERCIGYSKEAIKKAEKVYRNYLKEEQQRWAILKRKERELQSAQEFVWKHKGLPTNYHSLSGEDQGHYDKAMDQYNDGSLKPIMQQRLAFKRREERQALINDEEYANLAGTVEEGKIREDALLKNLFYYANELTPQESSFLQKFHAYKKGKASDLDGKGFVKVIFRKVGRETDKHFFMKHSFARLHHSAEIEKTDPWGNEIDVLFTKGKLKIPIEIETGTNKINTVIEKVSKLRRHYKKIIVIVNRKHLPKYKVHKDNKQVFVKTPKNGKEELLKWLS